MMAAAALPHSTPDVFESLFAREYPRAVAIALRITGDAAEAEDVAQDVFVQCARRGRDRQAGAAAWIHSAAVHAALNTLRSRRRRIERETRSALLQVPSYASAQSGADPQTIALQRIDRETVRAAVARLREQDAKLLALRYGGLSYQECADALGVSINQIGTRLARAERALKKELS